VRLEIIATSARSRVLALFILRRPMHISPFNFNYNALIRSHHDHAQRRLSISSSVTTIPIARSATSNKKATIAHNSRHLAFSNRLHPPHQPMTTRDAGPPMTTLYSRSPLQPLTMSSSQRPTRRKTRHTFDDDEAPPAKRSKVDVAAVSTGAVKSVNGKTKSVASKRSKAGM
jgi:hypothetical protein